ncbi:hypothetical protein F5Y18DRAFT_426405 [Xylariaceae sp. FL1019]|nr:hypothetical protein F5Y18DRAFT_426405 [Xylariaceae sp. FL1019]
MPSRSQTAAATALMAFATGVNSHMIMASPFPFGVNKGLSNSPLTSANYPCQVGSDPASFYSKDGIDMSKNTMAVGETQQLTFNGSAVHGGGSCQLAITTDQQPSASTSWQVIQSIEGGCPSKDGNGPSTYDYQIPDGVAPGDYVFAWTWIIHGDSQWSSQAWKKLYDISHEILQPEPQSAAPVTGVVDRGPTSGQELV